MPNNRVLILANSIYQLLTAIHMKKSLLCGRETDLIITDVTPKLPDCLPRLKDTGLFSRVFLAKTRELSKTYKMNRAEDLTEAFQASESLLRWALSDELGTYSEIYFSNFDLFTRMLACRFYPLPCPFICYEDGFSSYVIDFLREERAAVNRHAEGKKIREKLAGFLLYEPHLSLRGDGFPNRPLPKIQRDDLELRSLLNYIFDYRRPQDPAAYIFLEQSFRAEGIKGNDIQLIQECRETDGPGRSVVKPHPRNPENLPFQLGLTRKYADDAPWELFLLNENPEKIAVITVCSNAALTSRIVFGSDMDTVMLYPLFEGKVLWKEDAILKQYLRKFQRQFAGKNYYVPQTIYELRNILSYLGGRHEQSS